MSKQKTGYREQWEEDFNWLTKCKENINNAYCAICKQSFRLGNAGLAQVRVHAGIELKQNFLR